VWWCVDYQQGFFSKAKLNPKCLAIPSGNGQPTINLSLQHTKRVASFFDVSTCVPQDADIMDGTWNLHPQGRWRRNQRTAVRDRWNLVRAHRLLALARRRAPKFWLACCFFSVHWLGHSKADDRADDRMSYGRPLGDRALTTIGRVRDVGYNRRDSPPLWLIM